MIDALFWIAAGLLVWSQAGYPVVVAALAALRGRRSPAQGFDEVPDVSLIVAAYQEADVIEAKVANAFELDHPRDRFELIVACDGSTDGTPERAERAGADHVLELPRGGKEAAQDAAVAIARGEVLAFSDANALWEPQALAQLLRALSGPGVGYACGRVRFLSDAGTNQEGLYWRYEMWLRGNESRLSSVTAGNGAIYAVRREALRAARPIPGGHDISLPFRMVKAGWRAVDVPLARATERMVPSIEGEFQRKRRMMRKAWPVVLRGGMLSPRGYPPGYALMIASHRALRYATPLLHAVALATNVALLGNGAVYVAALAAQAAVLAGAALAGAIPARPLLVARYYVLTTASLALGLVDWLARGRGVGWEPAEGTR